MENKDFIQVEDKGIQEHISPPKRQFLSFSTLKEKLQAFAYALRWSQMKRHLAKPSKFFKLSFALAALASGYYYYQNPNLNITELTPQSAFFAKTVSFSQNNTPLKSTVNIEDLRMRFNFVSEEQQQNYIERFEHVAIAESEKFNIPKDIILALAILSSEFGSNNLAVEANNHTGIYCDNNLLNQDILMPIEENNICYTHYSKAWASFRGLSLYLSSPKFEELRKVAGNNSLAWARGLESLGFQSFNFSAENLIFVLDEFFN